MAASRESWFTPKGILKILLFPLLIMVNPKIYFPYEEDDEFPRVDPEEPPPGSPEQGKES